MAKPITVTWNKQTSAFQLKKLDRKRLYRHRKRLVLDASEAVCERAELTDDGSVLIRRGMTAQGYFNEAGHWVQNKELVGVQPDGTIVSRVPSTLGVAQDLTGPIDPKEVLNLKVKSVYMLDAETGVDQSLMDALMRGECFRFAFAYTSTWQQDTGILLANDEGIFAMIGQAFEPEWCELEQIMPEVFDDDDDDDDDLDFDFDM